MKNENVIKLIIDISVNMKIVYFIHVLKYFIQNYDSLNNVLSLKNYKTHLSSIDYLQKIIGLYQYYTKELRLSIMIKDKFGNDPFFICAQNNNYNFLFNVLLKEKNIRLNSTNNEGKSIIHIILEISSYLNEYKEKTLNRALASKFDFNIKDKYDMLPIDYAYLEKDYNIINILTNSYKKSKIPIPQNRNIMPKNKITYNFHKDADIFYKESIVVSAKIDKNENLDEIISPTFTYDKTKLLYQVCIEKESGIPYSVNLVKKDFITYDEKNDKKLCIQLLHEIVNEQYLIITIENDNTVNQSLYPNLSTA
jgi:hypothetical protein